MPWNGETVASFSLTNTATRHKRTKTWHALPRFRYLRTASVVLTSTVLSQSLLYRRHINDICDAVLRLYLFPPFLVLLRCSVGLPGCPSALRPGVWHAMPVLADHMWTHVDETYASEALERLAFCLRLVTDSNPTANPASRLSGSRRTGVRRSPRLLAKARRAGTATVTAVYRSECGEEGPAGRGACGNALISPPGMWLHDPGNGVRCDVCVVEGVDKGGGDINNGEGTVPIHGGLRRRRGLCTLVVIACMVAGMILLLCFRLVATPKTTHGNGGSVRRDCPAETDAFFPEQGPTAVPVFGSV